MLPYGFGPIADRLDRALNLVLRYAEFLRPIPQFPFLVDVNPVAVATAALAEIVCHWSSPKLSPRLEREIPEGARVKSSPTFYGRPSAALLDGSNARAGFRLPAPRVIRSGQRDRRGAPQATRRC